MKTWQDLLEVGAAEHDRMAFCEIAINEHRVDPKTVEAADAQKYYAGENVTISLVQKFITDAMGRQVADTWSPNHKIKAHLYPYFVNQLALYLLGNGVSFGDENTLEKLGKGFEKTVLYASISALNGGVSFGFWNLDHLEKFDLTEFVPLKDEETGRLMGGIRYWQLTPQKPLRITLFEPDGYTEYIKRKGEETAVLTEKRPYQLVVTTSATGMEIAPGKSYPGLPIVPLENVNCSSEMHGNREGLDAYDLILSKIINNIDNGEFIYWIVKNAPYMQNDPEILQDFLQRLKKIGVVATGDGQEVDAHKVEIPFEATEAGINTMRKQLFDDFMAFDPKSVTNGADTATQIIASYEPLNEKTDLFEYQVTEFIEGILELAGIDDKPTYTRSMIVNQSELINNILAAAAAGRLSEEYITKKLLDILGDADKVDEVMAQLQADEAGRFEEEETEDETGVE